MIMWIAYGIAVAATLLLVRHVARRYRSAPKRVPSGIGFDGRPSKQSFGKPILWTFPSILVVILAIMTGALIADPPRTDQHGVMALVFITLAEIAWLGAWTVDRQIEMARKMTFRIAPARLLRAFTPLLATIAAILVLALRS